ncbi:MULTISPECIES: ABC transporter substrate-binding protein [Clostridium]|uniref:ABC transporter substrate-binding protein n=1 Tax=Clostridium senegalense TaxID=1465809 RepID=A0A6M0H9U2_9CLOT|nr:MULTISPECIES: ABC transporter substrate-binding protein [Clostridium]NEU06402.1 ABC transporter substrate-binding protein [Clostridium senegalense]
MRSKNIKKTIMKTLCTTLCIAMTVSFMGCSSNNKSTNTNSVSTENSSTKENKNSSYPVTIKNYNVNNEEIEITFDKAPERVLTTNQTTTELMLDLGLEDKLIGTCYLDNPISEKVKDKYAKIPVVSEKYPTKEQVLSLNPDFIFGWKSVFADKTLGDVSEWIGRGTNTFAQRNTVKSVGNYTVENLFKDIDDLGTIFNIKDKTDKYIQDNKDRLTKIEEKTNSIDKKKTTLILESEEKGDFRLYGKNDLVSDMALKAGLENLGEESGTVSLENIVSLNPDTILLIHDGDGKDIHDPEIAKIFTSNEALKNVTAVKNNAIVVTGLAETWAGGIRVVDAIERYSKELYPELYK